MIIFPIIICLTIFAVSTMFIIRAADKITDGKFGKYLQSNRYKAIIIAVLAIVCVVVAIVRKALHHH